MVAGVFAYLDNIADPKHLAGELLHDAIAQKDLGIFKKLLAKNPLLNVEKNKKMPIQLAVELHLWDCVEDIAKTVKADSKDTARYGYALAHAAFYNQTEVVIALLNANAPTDLSYIETGNYPIHYAIQHNNIDMVSVILQKTLNDLERKNKNAQTPLQLAISLGYSEIANKISTITELSRNIIAEALEKHAEIISDEEYERADRIDTFLQKMPVINEEQKTREERLQLQQELIQRISILSSKLTSKTDACCMTSAFFKKTVHKKEKEKRMLSSALAVINQQILTDEPATQEAINTFNRELENNSKWKDGVFSKKTAQAIERTLTLISVGVIGESVHLTVSASE